MHHIATGTMACTRPVLPLTLAKQLHAPLNLPTATLPTRLIAKGQAVRLSLRAVHDLQFSHEKPPSLSRLLAAEERPAPERLFPPPCCACDDDAGAEAACCLRWSCARRALFSSSSWRAFRRSSSFCCMMHRFCSSRFEFASSISIDRHELRKSHGFTVLAFGSEKRSGNINRSNTSVCSV
jgi:hypothetical protein